MRELRTRQLLPDRTDSSLKCLYGSLRASDDKVVRHGETAGRGAVAMAA